MAVSKVNGAAQIAELADLGAEHAKIFAEAKEEAKDEILSLIFADEKKATDELIAATKKDKVVINLAEFDAARDNAIMDAASLAKALKKLKNATKSAAAARVSAVFDKYTGITRLSNANESGQIASLLSDLKGAEVAAALEALPEVAEAIDDIKAAEEAFQDARHKSEAGIATSGLAASKVKKSLVSTINDKLTPYLSVVTLVKPAVYEDLANKISVSISKLNTTVLQRTKK